MSSSARPDRRAPLAALLLDAFLGEPSTPAHPVAWMGRAIAAGQRLRTGRAPLHAFGQGALLVAGGAAAAAALAYALERGIGAAPPAAGPVVRGAALKPALSLRALLSAGTGVEGALRAGDLPEARRLLAWHLVSRETRDLSGAEVAGASIESLAENLSDSWVAPLLAFRAGGLPGAYLYRWINTCDAMLGYRTAELEWFGKPAARADDALNWVPARLTALLIAAAAPSGGGSPREALRLARRDAGLTPSPNAGWPMAAMAGALGVRLIKRDAYALHAEAREPTVGDLARARRIVAVAGLLATTLGAA